MLVKALERDEARRRRKLLRLPTMATAAMRLLRRPRWALSSAGLKPVPLYVYTREAAVSGFFPLRRAGVGRDWRDKAGWCGGEVAFKHRGRSWMRSPHEPNCPGTSCIVASTLWCWWRYRFALSPRLQLLRRTDSTKGKAM
jgi:hypothetical protein